MTLKEIIINYRKEHGLSQRQFGAQCSLSSGYISMLEKGINPNNKQPFTPSLGVLKKISDGMGITLDDLLKVADDMPVIMSDETPKRTLSLFNGIGSSKMLDSAMREYNKQTGHLSDDEYRIIELYRKLTPAQKVAINEFLNRFHALSEEGQRWILDATKMVSNKGE